MSLNFTIGQRVIVGGTRPLIDRVAFIDSAPEVASHQRDASWYVPTIYRVVYERLGDAEWVLSSRLQGYGHGSRSIVRWADCDWQPKPEIVSFLERSGIGQRLTQLCRAVHALKAIRRTGQP